MKSATGFRVRFPEWLIISTFLALMTLAITAGDWLWRVDQLLYDAQLSLWQRPPAEDIVLVSIDDASLSELGSWPWSREIHARLIQRLSDAGAKVIALDILFAQKNSAAPQSDQALVKAVAESERVVLPVIIEQTRLGGQLRETLPFPELSEAAAAMGHVHIDLDQDGIARRTYLKEGLVDAWWPSFSIALLRLIDPDSWIKLPGARNQFSSPGKPQTIRRDYQVYIAFAGPPGHFPRLSYAQVLDGEFLQDLFKDKIVLVGVTATGLGDSLPTPVSGFSRPMSGVEIHANLIDALRRGIMIQPIPTNWVIGLSLLFVLLPLFIYPRLQPQNALLCGGVMLLVVFGFNYLLLQTVHLWFPPAASLLGLLIGYPLWSWRRLEQTSKYLNQELQRLRHEPLPINRHDGFGNLTKGLDFLRPILQLKGWTLLNAAGQVIEQRGISPQVPVALTSIEAGHWSRTAEGWWIRIPRISESWLLGLHNQESEAIERQKLAWLHGLTHPYAETVNKTPKSTAERLEQQIQDVRDAVGQLRTASGLLSDILSRMADGLIVTDPGGTIILANDQASCYLDAEPGSDTPQLQLLAFTQQVEISGQLEWRSVLQSAFINHAPVRFEARHTSGTEFFMQVAPWLGQEGAVLGIILTLSDITSLKESENKRAETLSFLSHDMRSPLTSLLSLVQTQRRQYTQYSSAKLTDQVEYYATKALKIADEFLHMARAENIEPDKFHDLNLVALFYNAADEAFSKAQAKKIKLERHITVDEAWVSGDADLLERALANLIDNAIRHSHELSHLDLQLSIDDDSVHCCIKDTGEGIPAEYLKKIFDPFIKLGKEDQHQQTRTGLGLAFVKTVADKHRGKVTVESEVSQGSRFCLMLPLLISAEIECESTEASS